MNTLTTRWRKLLSLSWAERRFLAQAVVGLAWVGLLVSIFGFNRALGWLRVTSASRRTAPFGEGTLPWARARARLVTVAAHHGLYRATCLRRSLYLWWFLRRRGLTPELKIGAKRSGDKKLLAHAWIELDGDVVNDDDRLVSEYPVFDSRALPEKVSWS